MTEPLDVADHLTWSLARRCRPGDVLVIGVGTPLALGAALLARELLVPDLTIIVSGSVDPRTQDLADGLLDPAAVARSAAGRLAHTEILEAIQRGAVTLQFVAPAQVDGAGRINTSRVTGADGRPRRLPGPLALPDVAVLVGRLVAYRADHSPRFLVPRVDFATGAGNDLDRGGLPGAGVTDVVTGLAEIAIPPGGGPARLAALQPGAALDDALAGCGFPLEHDADVPVAEPPPAEALALLRGTIDPSGVRLLELPGGRADALARLQARGG